MKKKYKQVELKSMLEDFDKLNLDEAICMLSKLSQEYPDHINFRLKAEYHYESTDIILVADRLETDEEFVRRKKRTEAAKKAIAKRKAKKEEEEKILYKKLKQKYEDK